MVVRYRIAYIRYLVPIIHHPGAGVKTQAGEEEVAKGGNCGIIKQNPGT
jgi:hypothetical protein